MVLLLIMKTSMEQKPDYHEIACQQILAEDQSVFSIQWVVIPGVTPLRLTSGWLLDRYLAYVERFTCAVVRPALTENSLEFRLGNSTVPLIKFNLPLHADTMHGTSTTLRICGGYLVQPKECDRGQLDFIVEEVAAGVRITLQLSDYCPLLLGSNRPSLWRKWLYRLTQAYIHKIVTIRFLAMIYRQLTGSRPKSRVVKVALRKGEET